MLRIGKHRIVENIASLRKVNIAHPYPRAQQFNISMSQILDSTVLLLVRKAKTIFLVACSAFLPHCSDVVECVAGLLLSLLLLLPPALLQENRVGWAEVHCCCSSYIAASQYNAIQCRHCTRPGYGQKPHWDRNSRRTALQ